MTVMSRGRRRRAAEVTCDEAAAVLPSVLDGEFPASGPLVAHVESCLRCQAELARYRRLLRLLHQLHAVEPELPAGLVSDVVTALEQAAHRRAVRSALTGRRAGYTGALAGAGAAAAAVVFLARARTRGAELERTAGA